MKMTKEQLLRAYADKVLFDFQITLEDVAQFIPDDFNIDRDDVPLFFRHIEKGLDAGLMNDWDEVAEIAVEGSKFI